MKHMLAAFLILCAWPTHAQEPRSGYDFMEPATQAMQDDDFLNPAFFLIDQGLNIWNAPVGPNELSCSSCHGDASTMRGVAARYPAYDPETGTLMNLELRVMHEFSERMAAGMIDYDAPEVMALTTLISYQSRGLEMRPGITEAEKPFVLRGQEIYEQRRGQLNLSCPQCHVEHAGDRLRGDVISEGQINAFPIYRLLWSEPGSRHRMFEWCMQSVRAEPYPRGSAEFVALELYLATRGAGLAIEAPGVRR